MFLSTNHVRACVTVYNYVERIMTSFETDFNKEVSLFPRAAEPGASSGPPSHKYTLIEQSNVICITCNICTAPLR